MQRLKREGWDNTRDVLKESERETDRDTHRHKGIDKDKYKDNDKWRGVTGHRGVQRINGEQWQMDDIVRSSIVSSLYNC